MWERVVWTMVSVGVVALAGYEGGPHRLDDFRLSSIWGATPLNCNANKLDATKCPPYFPDGECKQGVRICRAEPGARTFFCTNGTGDLVCQVPECVTQRDPTIRFDCVIVFD